MTMPDGPTSSMESVYERLGTLSGKMDAVIAANAAVTNEAGIGRALALRLEENRTVEKANAAATELSNRRFLGKFVIGALTLAGLCLGILYYLHSIYHWPA